MNDLTEFLLARIAEDEAVARAEDAFITEFIAPQRAKTSWAPSPFEAAGIGPERVLAECEAKRRIVEQVSDTAWASYAVRDFVLAHLALPYAVHPDYREEWRP